MGLKLGKGAGFPSKKKSSGPKPISVLNGVLIYPAIWLQWTWAENWGLCSFFWGGGAGSPSYTMWPGPRPTSVPSFILIHPTVWPQKTNVTYMTDKQDMTDMTTVR